jgi:GTPase SAR1 family protein
MSTILRTKCVIVGNPTVGKTALTKMFVSDGGDFPKNYIMVRLICSSTYEEGKPLTKQVILLVKPCHT